MPICFWLRMRVGLQVDLQIMLSVINSKIGESFEEAQADWKERTAMSVNFPE